MTWTYEMIVLPFYLLYTGVVLIGFAIIIYTDKVRNKCIKEK
jgi:hypothetical protein